MSKLMSKAIKLDTVENDKGRTVLKSTKRESKNRLGRNGKPMEITEYYMGETVIESGKLLTVKYNDETFRFLKDSLTAEEKAEAKSLKSMYSGLDIADLAVAIRKKCKALDTKHMPQDKLHALNNHMLKLVQQASDIMMGNVEEEEGPYTY